MHGCSGVIQLTVQIIPNGYSLEIKGFLPYLVRITGKYIRQGFLPVLPVKSAK